MRLATKASGFQVSETSSGEPLPIAVEPCHCLRGTATALGFMIDDLLSDGDTLMTVAVGNNPSTMNVSDQHQKRS